MARHEIFREGLAGLELRGALGRTEHLAALRFEPIDQAARRAVPPARPRSNRCVPDRRAESRRRCPSMSIGAVASTAGYPRVAGRADHMGDVGVLRELPGQGVLACAGAENEDPTTY